MSGAPKRLHEEGGHPTPSKHPLEDTSVFPNLPGKSTQSVANEYHCPFEQGPDGRLVKGPRTELRDADKRSPALPLYRMSISANDSCLDHIVTSENKSESKDIEKNRDLKENRDSKAETRELSSEARMDSQFAKGEKDVRLENRGVDNKEAKQDREIHTDFKGEMKLAKDGYTAGNTHMNWKEPKEQHRGKRYAETPADGLDPWRIPRSNSQGSVEIRKGPSTTEERDYVEANEAVGENKVDLKGEDKFKEKERKRRDEKHRDWGERDKDRSDRRNNFQLGSSSNDRKESTREERETERWERERKDLQKDNERPKEREKDHIKRETWNGVEKEGSHSEKELVDGSVKMLEQENPSLEQKGLKDFDSWKAVDRDAKDRRKERDVDVEGDRHEKRSRCFDKESDDGCTDDDGGTEREREVFSYGVQQRKRMLRPRGSPQVANREPRFRSRTRDNEGICHDIPTLESCCVSVAGKPEISTVVYKVGECMQELLKLWKEYESSQDKTNDENSHNGPTLEIRVPAEYITATNRQVSTKHPNLHFQCSP
ncbi:hypothetical protein HHK36_004559 [Tetracentron sinense]|uniref:Uncharacterized protein n=1 Tax=Tetracentron sinense TaxID=13715 RepID=A0A834ZV54_TETSI|nr:hypothetical protein HHK36_004559 [Tetracentron sinense]